MTKKLTIEQSFQKFLTNLNPTEKQLQAIQKTRASIDNVLSNDQRIFLHTQKQPSFLTGSYSRGTIIRPIDDIDLYVRVHYSKHAENKTPRSILVLIASALRKRYPNNTKINVDSPCVAVSFFGYKFEVVPVVCYSYDDNLYDIPAPGSKSWMQCYPHIPSKWLSSSNQRNKKMFIPLIKMLKQWNRTNKMNFKSFHIELLTEKVFSSVTDIYSYPQGIMDWMYCVREWFWDNNYPFITEPGHNNKFIDDYIYEKKFRVNVIRNKLDKAIKRAERAYDLYLKGKDIPARRIWKNMFGTMYPSPDPLPIKPILTPPKQTPPPTLRDIFTTQQSPVLGKLEQPSSNYLLGLLSNPKSKLPDDPNNNSNTNFLRGLLAGYNDPFKKY